MVHKNGPTGLSIGTKKQNHVLANAKIKFDQINPAINRLNMIRCEG